MKVICHKKGSGINVMVSVYVLVIIALVFLPEIISAINEDSNLTGTQKTVIRVVPTILVIGLLVYSIKKSGVQSLGK